MTLHSDYAERFLSFVDLHVLGYGPDEPIPTSRYSGSYTGGNGRYEPISNGRNVSGGNGRYETPLQEAVTTAGIHNDNRYEERVSQVQMTHTIHIIMN
jgi:hypothetical protein